MRRVSWRRALVRLEASCIRDGLVIRHSLTGVARRVFLLPETILEHLGTKAAHELRGIALVEPLQVVERRSADAAGIEPHGLPARRAGGRLGVRDDGSRRQ